VTRVLAISDEVSDALYGDRLKGIGADIVVSCGDLPFDYLEYVVTVTNVPLLYVFGNHDPAPRREERALDLALRPPFLRAFDADSFGPEGCTNVDGRILDVGGLRIAGLGGSTRYSEGPYQYTESQMRRRSLRLELHARLRKLRDGRTVDVLMAHSPPRDLGDDPDPAHRGFRSFHRLVRALSPQVMVHGHVHPHGRELPDHRIGDTSIVNAVGYKLLEVGP
jgi:predicted phosphodiesterase